MKPQLLISIAILLNSIVACGSKSQDNGPVCTQYPSAYEVQYPDGLKKSNVAACDGYYKATPIGGGPSIQATGLIVRLVDRNGTFYLTDFSGQ